MITFDRYLWDLSSLRDGERKFKMNAESRKESITSFGISLLRLYELVTKGKKNRKLFNFISLDYGSLSWASRELI